MHGIYFFINSISPSRLEGSQGYVPSALIVPRKCIHTVYFIDLHAYYFRPFKVGALMLVRGSLSEKSTDLSNGSNSDYPLFPRHCTTLFAWLL